ncbi:MAG: hypothetical protein EZS28_036296, partial [Streblomastix strix]
VVLLSDCQANVGTRRTSAIVEPSTNRCVTEIKVHGHPTKKQGNQTKIDISDLASEEERQILLQITVDPSVAVKQKKEKDSKKQNKDIHKTKKNQQPVIEQQILPLGEIRFQFSRTEGGPEEQIVIPLSILVDDDEYRRDLINGDESITVTQEEEEQIESDIHSHVQSIERVIEFVMNDEDDAVKNRAVEEMGRWNANGARYVLNAHRQRQQAIQIASSKPAYYGLDLNGQGQCEAESKKYLKQQFLLSLLKKEEIKVERQEILIEKEKEVEVEVEVEKEQERSRERNIDRERSRSRSIEREQEISRSRSRERSRSRKRERNQDSGIRKHIIFSKDNKSFNLSEELEEEEEEQIQSIPSIPKPAPIKLLPPEQQNSIQGKINKTLFQQQQDLDDIEEQLAAAEGNAMIPLEQLQNLNIITRNDQIGDFSQPNGGARPQVVAQPQGGPQPQVVAQPQGGPQPQVVAQPQGGPQPQVVAQPQGGPQPQVEACYLAALIRWKYSAFRFFLAKGFDFVQSIF